MKILIDMNLSPDWRPVLRHEGWEAVHWSEVGDPRAKDEAIMAWARERSYVVFTHDLDFGALLAATQATGPSVIQVRAQDVLPAHLGQMVVKAIKDYSVQLLSGAIVTVEEARGRVRLLPLTRSE